MRNPARHPLVFALALAASALGCFTVRDPIAPIEPRPNTSRVSLEYTVGEFRFAMGTNAPSPSLLDGRLLGREIVHAWRDRGYLSGYHFVHPGDAFTGTADYQLTISGHQHNDASFWIEVLNALTLMLYPYTVSQEYDMQFVLEKPGTGVTYRAAIRASDTTWVELFLLFAAPVSQRGHEATMQAAGDRLYDYFARQGAFPDTVPEATGRAPDPAQP